MPSLVVYHCYNVSGQRWWLAGTTHILALAAGSLALTSTRSRALRRYQNVLLLLWSTLSRVSRARCVQLLDHRQFTCSLCLHILWSTEHVHSKHFTLHSLADLTLHPWQTFSFQHQLNFSHTTFFLDYYILVLKKKNSHKVFSSNSCFMCCFLISLRAGNVSVLETIPVQCTVVDMWMNNLHTTIASIVCFPEKSN